MITQQIYNQACERTQCPRTYAVSAWHKDTCTGNPHGTDYMNLKYTQHKPTMQMNHEHRTALTI